MDKNLKGLVSTKLNERINSNTLPSFGDYAPIETGWCAKVTAIPYDIAEGMFPPRNMEEDTWTSLSEDEKNVQGIKREWITVATTRRRLSLRTLLTGGSFEPRTPEAFFESSLSVSLPGKWITCTGVNEVERNGIKLRTYTWDVSDTAPNS